MLLLYYDDEQLAFSNSYLLKAYSENEFKTRRIFFSLFGEVMEINEWINKYIYTLCILLLRKPNGLIFINFYLLLQCMAEPLVQKTVASLESFTSFKIAIYLAIFVVITTVLLEIQVFWDVPLFSHNRVICALSHVTRLAIFKIRLSPKGTGIAQSV